MKESQNSDRLEARLIALEERTMHLEHLLDELNGVVCSMQNRLDKQHAAISHLNEMSRRLAASNEEKRSLEDDRPPHY